MQLINLFCVVITSFIFIGCSNMSLYYVKDAKINIFSENDKKTIAGNRQESSKLLLNGHYIKPGNNLVLLVRRFDKGSIFTVDDESYEKLTVEIKNYTFDKPIKLSSPDVRFYYSNGSSGFVSKGHGVYSASGSGSIIVKKNKMNKIAVELNLIILAKPAGAFPFEGRTVKIQELLIFKEIQIAGLTPWLGVPGLSLGEEVYP